MLVLTRRSAQCRTAVALSLRVRQRRRRQCLPPAGTPQPPVRGGGVPQSCMSHATAAPIAYANSAPAVDTSMIMMGTVYCSARDKSLGVLSSCIQPYPAISKLWIHWTQLDMGRYEALRLYSQGLSRL